MKLSILICTLESRVEQLQIILKVLQRQSNKDVEILIESDNGELSTGSKRQKLLERAIGDYICYVDDDDMVSNNYVDSILNAISYKPDCVGIIVEKRKDDLPYRKVVKTTQTLKNQWIWNFNEKTNTQSMIPDHLTPVKREIALKVGFKDISKGEDTVYSIGIIEYLKTEIFIDTPIYLYDLKTTKKLYENVENNPKVTAITITKDRVDFVKQSIGYFKDQTHKNTEMIIVCHGNSETKKELSAFVKSETNIKFIEVKDEVTKGYMINIAIKESNSDYCIQWDDDDYHSPKRIEQQLIPIQYNVADVTTLATFKMDNGELVKDVLWCDGLDGTMLWKNTGVLSPEVTRGHDTAFMQVLKSKYRTLKIYDDYSTYTYFIHDMQMYSKKEIFNTVTAPYKVVKK